MVAVCSARGSGRLFPVLTGLAVTPAWASRARFLEVDAPQPTTKVVAPRTSAHRILLLFLLMS